MKKRKWGLVLFLVFISFFIFSCQTRNEESNRKEEAFSEEDPSITIEEENESLNMNGAKDAIEITGEIKKLGKKDRAIILEAEHATLTDLVVENKLDGHSGSGYVTGFTNETGTVTFAVNSDVEGLYSLTIGFATPHGEKRANLLLNHEGMGEVTFKEVDGFSEVAAGSIYIEKGFNTISLEKGWGWYVVDYIKLKPSHPVELHQVEKKLMNPNATEEAKRLYSFLVDHYGKNILSGQQDYNDLQYIQEHTGKLPAILGLDLMDYSPSRVERGTTSSDIEHAIDWWHNKGGIVTFAWHWNAPKDLIDEPGKEWWRGFYTEATTFDLEYALNNRDSEDFQLLIRDIDVISEHLKRLQDEKVPILWRPLHEAEGGWFWWGAKGPEPAKELWKIMYDRMTNHHQLHHLIWVWNSVGEDWYPGDEYVDIVSYDSYPGAYNYTPVSNYYEELRNLVNDQKLIALTENGPIPDPDQLIKYKAHWSWFCTWSGEILREQTDIEHLIKVYNHEYVITLDELPDLKKYRSSSNE